MTGDKNKRVAYFILGILFFSNILAWTAVYNLRGANNIEVIFFNVGQGDAILIKNTKNHQILIDGGPDSAVLGNLAAEVPFYDRTLDLVILTHPEKDHLSGLLDVLKRYRVENILWTGIIRDTSEFKEWQKLIKEEEASVKIALAGQRIILSAKPPSYIEILSPAQDLEGQEFKDSNDTSVVARLVFGEKSFLFTGDISGKIETELIGENIDSDILKISHHGSKSANSEDFIKKVSPEVAVIEVGENKYGLPSKEVLESLEKFGIKIFRTDENGDVKIISDGKNIKIE